MSTANNFGFLSNLGLGVIYVITALIFLLAIEGGFRLGRYMQSKSPDTAESGVGTVVGSTLALFVFLLAFVASIGINLVMMRNNLVVKEANAIGTTYLRAGYLPEPISTESRDLLREYVDWRLLALDPTQTEAAIVRSEEIQTELWSRAETVAKELPLPTTSLYIATVNDVIDVHAERINAGLVMRIPSIIFIVLYIVGIFAIGLVGLHAGYREHRNIAALTVFILILSVVFLLIFDLDRSQTGLIQVSQRAMLDLQRQLSVGQ